MRTNDGYVFVDKEFPMTHFIITSDEQQYFWRGDITNIDYDEDTFILFSFNTLEQLLNRIEEDSLISVVNYKNGVKPEFTHRYWAILTQCAFEDNYIDKYMVRRIYKHAGYEGDELDRVIEYTKNEKAGLIENDLKWLEKQSKNMP